MNPSLPEPHSNPETFLDEPVYIFTDKAIVPPGRSNGPTEPPPSDKPKTPAPPPEEPEKH